MEKNLFNIFIEKLIFTGSYFWFRFCFVLLLFFSDFQFFFSLLKLALQHTVIQEKKNICQAFMYTPPSTKVLVYQLKTKEKCVCMCERASARARPLTCNLWLKEDNCKKDRKYQNLQKKKKQLLT